MYIHTYMYTYICIYMYVYIFKYTCICVHICISSPLSRDTRRAFFIRCQTLCCMHTCVCIVDCMHTCVCIDCCMHTCVCIDCCMHTCVCIVCCMHTCVCIVYADICTHTHGRSPRFCTHMSQCSCMYTHVCVIMHEHTRLTPRACTAYGVAMISMLLKNTGLFCRIQSVL